MQAQSVETVTPALDTADLAAEPAAALETNFGNEQPVVTVPYSTLQRSPLNVRTKPPSAIAGLAANYEKHAVMRTWSQEECLVGIKGHIASHYGKITGRRARQASLGFAAIAVGYQGESSDLPAAG
ncbi:hypothetical protein [Burkholderia cepacia]|uniref:hypothetical protein n=1 Tax=Burkholderia cepacia TaxID=292 RepID=UPI0026C98A37